MLRALRSSPFTPVRAAALAVFALGAAGAPIGRDAHAAPAGDLPLPPRAWKVVAGHSGPVNYFQLVDDPVLPFLRAEYRPPLKTVVMGYQVADDDRPRARGLRWMWRATALPRGGDECAKGREDSAGVVYVTWKRGLRWYTIKYVWSAVGAKGATCDRRRNPFVAQDTQILESGGPTGVWKIQELDLRREFRAHFEDGKADADVPDFVGVGVMSDGDQTQSPSGADYAQFVLLRD
jgi:hypothetical protein